MNGVQPSAWAGGGFAPHPTDPQLGHALPDQLVPQRDPVIDPGLVHRSAPARPYNPAAPIRLFVEQETHDPATWPQAVTSSAGLGPANIADAMFLDDVLSGQEEDNKPVGIYAAPAGAAPAAAAPWPALDAAPTPGRLAHLASVHSLEDPFLSTPLCPNSVPTCCDSEL